MAQRQKAPAFDTMYDNTSNTEISRAVTSSPMRYSGRAVQADPILTALGLSAVRFVQPVSRPARN